jgi:hypothetical protein
MWQMVLLCSEQSHSKNSFAVYRSWGVSLVGASAQGFLLIQGSGTISPSLTNTAFSAAAVANARWFSCQQSSFLRFSQKQHIIFSSFHRFLHHCNAFAKMDFYNSLVKEKCTSLTTGFKCCFMTTPSYLLQTTII